MTMLLIQNQTLGSNASWIEFSSIPQDGTDLYFLISARTTLGDLQEAIRPSFNGSTSGFTNRQLYGVGSGGGQTDNPPRDAGYATGNAATASTFSNSNLYIPNYAGNANKSYSVDSVIENNGASTYLQLLAGFWSNTAAITTVRLTPASGNFVTGTTISLYKITKGSGGVVVS